MHEDQGDRRLGGRAGQQPAGSRVVGVEVVDLGVQRKPIVGNDRNAVASEGAERNLVPRGPAGDHPTAMRHRDSGPGHGQSDRPCGHAEDFAPGARLRRAHDTPPRPSAEST